MKRALITQSNYIPWKGYFNNIAQCDVFVVYDDMQYTKRDWRNRNRIKTATGPQWLSVPIEVKGRYDQPINATRINGIDWRKNHLGQLRHAYARAPYFKEVFPWIESVYMEQDHAMLTDLNVHLLKAVCERLDIHTEFLDSRSFDLADDRTQRLVEICLAVGANEYLTGPAAKAYMEEERFEAAGIRVVYADYGRFPEYAQLHPPFDHAVCIWDVLLNCGGHPREYVIQES